MDETRLRFGHVLPNGLIVVAHQGGTLIAWTGREFVTCTVEGRDRLYYDDVYGAALDFQRRRSG